MGSNSIHNWIQFLNYNATFRTETALLTHFWTQISFLPLTCGKLIYTDPNNICFYLQFTPPSYNINTIFTIFYKFLEFFCKIEKFRKSKQSNGMSKKPNDGAGGFEFMTDRGDKDNFLFFYVAKNLFNI